MVDKEMDERVARLTSPEDCEKFAKNAVRLGRPDLADQARRHSIDLRAAEYGDASDVEKECIQAILAYEEVLSRKNGRRTRATRTWQMIKRRGILGAVERAVSRPVQTAGYELLAEMGLADLAFEAVVLRYPDQFSEEVIERSRSRMRQLARGNVQP